MSSCGTCLHYMPSGPESLGGMCTRHDKLVALVSTTCGDYDENNPFGSIAKVTTTAFPIFVIILLLMIPLLGIGYVGYLINSKIQAARDALYATPIVSDLNNIDSTLAFYDLDDDGCIRINDLKWHINQEIGLNNGYEGRHELKAVYSSYLLTEVQSMRETVRLVETFEDMHVDNYENGVIDEKAYTTLNKEFEKCKTLLGAVIYSCLGISYDAFAEDIANGSPPRREGDFTIRLASTNVNKNGKIDFSKTIFIAFDNDGVLRVVNPINPPQSGILSPL